MLANPRMVPNRREEGGGDSGTSNGLRSYRGQREHGFRGEQ